MSHSETSTNAGAMRVYADLQAALESGRQDDHWTSEWHVTLGAAAGLLIAKWAGCREALGLPDRDQRAEEHARALLQALGEASGRTATLRDLDPFRLPVMAAAKTLPETYKAIITWLRGVDLGSPDEREIGAAQYAIGLCRLLLTGVPGCGLVYGDALDGPFPEEHPADGFDCILAAPPWGRWSGGSESQFLRHVMSRLRPGGRAVVAASEGALYRTGSDERARKALLSEFRVEAVIALPRGAFTPTSIEARVGRRATT